MRSPPGGRNLCPRRVPPQVIFDHRPHANSIVIGKRVQENLSPSSEAVFHFNARSGDASAFLHLMSNRWLWAAVGTCPVGPVTHMHRDGTRSALAQRTRKAARPIAPPFTNTIWVKLRSFHPAHSGKKDRHGH
jgi:hypothetical protein